MRNYLILVPAHVNDTLLVWAPSFGRMMYIHAKVRAKNLDDAYMQSLAMNLTVGRVEIRTA